MKKNEFSLLKLLRPLLLPVVAVCALVAFSTALNSLSDGAGDESKRQLEEALRRSCAACYAAEGIYPPDVAYLQDRYGLQVDQERFVVHYEIFAENLMPDITVLERKP